MNGVLREAENRCACRGWKVVLVEKPLHGLYQTDDNPPPTITDAREAVASFMREPDEDDGMGSAS